MKRTLSTLLVVLAFAVMGFGQTILTNTTLSAAMPGPSFSALSTGNQGLAVVASATGISAPAPNTGNVYGAATSEAQDYLYVDRELMEVKSVSGTSIGVIRGVGGTSGASHASGAIVFVIPANFIFTAGDRFQALPQGSCTRSNEVFLPRIQLSSGIVSDCLGGQWLQGDAMQTTRSVTRLMSPPIGATLQTAIDTAGNAAGAATEQYCTQVSLPYSKLLTGMGLLNGTTVGTNKWLYILYDASGNLLANTAVAGTTTSGASTYQEIAFTSPFYAVGPATYFACFQANGTTDTYRRVNTAGNNGLYAGKLTGETFGTVPNPITVPSSFTTALGGYWEFY